MKHDTYEQITKWSGRAVTLFAFFITGGLAIGGLAFIGLGLFALAFFDAFAAALLLGSGSLFLCLGTIGLVRQLQLQARELRQRCEVIGRNRHSQEVAQVA